jgi:hypothetical protein
MKIVSKILLGLVVVLTIAFVVEWQRVKKAEEGPAQLVRDIDQHAFGGVERTDLEDYLSRRGGDISVETADGDSGTSSVDHVVFRDIRHLGDRREDLHGEFHYDAGDHLVYYSLKRTWTKPNQ